MRSMVSHLLLAGCMSGLLAACTSLSGFPLGISGAPSSTSSLVDNRGRLIDNRGQLVDNRGQVVSNNASSLAMTLSNGSAYSTQALAPPPGQPTITGVQVTFDQVQVHYDASASVATPPATESADGDPGWITFPASTSQTIDLANIAADSLFGSSADLKPGTYTQIRFKVKDAQVKLSDNSTASLDISSGNLKIIKPFEIKAGYKTTLHFDFDTTHSITSANGAYRMRPTAVHTVPTYEAIPAASQSAAATSSQAATSSTNATSSTTP